MIGTFKHFLMESRSQPISLEQVNQFTANNSQSFIQTGVGHILRGITSTNEDFVYAEPSGQRQSRFATQNWYNLIASNHPSWNDYPSREQSFISSNKRTVAGAYGDVYVAIVPDQTKIAVAPDMDFQVSFNNSYMEPLNLNGAIEGLFEYAYDAYQGDKQKVPQDGIRSSYPKLIQFLNTVKQDIDRFRQSKYDNIDYYHKFLNLLEQYSPEQVLGKILDPEQNGFTIVQAPQVGNVKHDAELWFSSPVVFIRGDIFADIEPQLIKATQ